MSFGNLAAQINDFRVNLDRRRHELFFLLAGLPIFSIRLRPSWGCPTWRACPSIGQSFGYIQRLGASRLRGLEDLARGLWAQGGGIRIFRLGEGAR